MSETILFNPRDSIGNFHDYNEAVRKGHLYKQKQRQGDDLVIVKILVKMRSTLFSTLRIVIPKKLKTASNTMLVKRFKISENN